MAYYLLGFQIQFGFNFKALAVFPGRLKIRTITGWLAEGHLRVLKPCNTSTLNLRCARLLLVVLYEVGTKTWPTCTVYSSIDIELILTTTTLFVSPRKFREGVCKLVIWSRPLIPSSVQYRCLQLFYL